MTGTTLVSARTIVSIETTAVERNFKPALVVRGAKSVHATSQFLFIRVTLQNGVEGFGEVSGTLNWSGEDASTAEPIIRELIAPLLIGMSLEDFSKLLSKIENATIGNSFTKAGVEMALWDALGKCENLPVYSLLGGKKRDEVQVKISISGDGQQIADGYEEARNSGFRKFKVKVGHGRTRDLPRFSSLRHLVGDAAYIGVDANCGWSRSEAEHCIEELKKMDVAFIEQPLDRQDYVGSHELRSFELPIVADESVFTESELDSVIREDAASDVSIYIGKSGGINNAYQMANKANKNGLGVIIGSNAELGIGTAAQLHVAAACSRLSDIPSDIIGHHFYTEDVLEVPNDIDGLVAKVNNQAGLGVRLLPEILRTFR
jgi:L-alanine-DL-glutamate epimerase-like enolase superfamily enzyme